ncbi:UNVERIFIED_ORG: hypothetical protein [Escherichia phage CMSTMSU]
MIITSENVDSNGIPLEPNQFREIVPNWTGEDAVKYGGILVFQENDDFTISVLSLPSDTFTILDSSWAYTMDQALAETNAYKRSEFVRNNAIRSTTLSGIYSKGSGFMVGFKYDGKYYFIEQTVGNNNDRLNQLIENLTYSDDTTAATPELAFYRAIVNIGTNADVNQKLDYYGYKDVTSQYTVKRMQELVLTSTGNIMHQMIIALTQVEQT